VKTRPGFAAFIDSQSPGVAPRAVIICLDPEAWGYTRTVRTSYVPDAERAAAAEAERQDGGRRAALATAATVRRAFLAQQYATARAAKKVYLDALRATLLNPRSLDLPETYAELSQSLAGASFETIEVAGSDRLTRMLVARWLTACEVNLDAIIADRRWGTDPDAARAYLDRLTTAGYTLSDAEQGVYDDLVAQAHADTDPDEDDDRAEDENQTEDDPEENTHQGDNDPDENHHRGENDDRGEDDERGDEEPAGPGESGDAQPHDADRGTRAEGESGPVRDDAPAPAPSTVQHQSTDPTHHGDGDQDHDGGDLNSGAGADSDEDVVLVQSA
jgi:hypothetical protein